MRKLVAEILRRGDGTCEELERHRDPRYDGFYLDSKGVPRVDEKGKALQWSHALYELQRVPGLGRATAMKCVDAGIRTIAALRAHAAVTPQVPRLFATTQQKLILNHIEEIIHSLTEADVEEMRCGIVAALQTLGAIGGGRGRPFLKLDPSRWDVVAVGGTRRRPPPSVGIRGPSHDADFLIMHLVGAVTEQPGNELGDLADVAHPRGGGEQRVASAETLRRSAGPARSVLFHREAKRGVSNVPGTRAVLFPLDFRVRCVSIVHLDETRVLKPNVPVPIPIVPHEEQTRHRFQGRRVLVAADAVLGHKRAPTKEKIFVDGDAVRSEDVGRDHDVVPHHGLDHPIVVAQDGIAIEHRCNPRPRRGGRAVRSIAVVRDVAVRLEDLVEARAPAAPSRALRVAQTRDPRCVARKLPMRSSQQSRSSAIDS